jgi:3-hydroxyisobutyrate dehydrogenase-like beta-hydroxyacid dehydrogenase
VFSDEGSGARSGRPVQVTVLGLGEAGGAFARDLVAAGAKVRVYDPVVPAPAGARACESEGEAAEGADLILSLTTAEHAEEALVAALPALGSGAVWADANTAAPALKRSLAQRCEDAGRTFVDLAIMAPVPGRGLRVPMLASGRWGPFVAERLGTYGAQVEVVGQEPGDAATRKLLRSVFYKGMAAAVLEALAAAEACGLRPWLAAHIAKELDEADARVLDRLVEGSRRHARRRTEEMEAAAQLVADLGLEPHVSTAAAAVLRDLQQGTTEPSGVSR